MIPLKKMIDKRSPYLFFIKFLLGFFALYLFFPFYWGLTGKGGSLYSAFLDERFNLIRQFSVFLTGASKLILEAFDYTVFQPNYHTVRIVPSWGISVNPNCLGWAVMSFWVAFVYANKGGVKHKLTWIISGIIAIVVLNITRITLIALARHHHWKIISSLDHHQTFNIFSYSCIFILMFWYTRGQKKLETFNVEQQQANRVSAVQ